VGRRATETYGFERVELSAPTSPKAILPAIWRSWHVACRRMRQRLPQHAQGMDARDLRQLGAASGEAKKAAADADDWREAAELIRKEQGIRQTLRETSPLGYLMEAKARATHLAEQQHRQAQHVRQTPAVRSGYQPPAPSRGRGPSR
jgi:hypothetical protein